jgi:hypothetical protein
MRFYCDGQAPTLEPDWRARQSEVAAVEDDGDRATAQAALDAERLAVASHLARNGNGPRVLLAGGSHAAALLDGVTLDGEPDEHGGRYALDREARPLLCPECLSPVRAVES